MMVTQTKVINAIPFVLSLLVAVTSPSRLLCSAFSSRRTMRTKLPSLRTKPYYYSSAATTSLHMANVGIFFGTSTGTTEDVGILIKDELGDDADGPFDIDDLEKSVKETFEQFDGLIVGTPTWNTGADTERSGTGWDEIYYDSMAELDMGDKNVAVFGCGDQISYGENFADATGELHDVFQNLGAKMEFGYTSQDGYEHEESKSIRGDKFCGLLCDGVNQDELTEDRVKNWVAQLKEEGFFEMTSSSSSSSPDSVSTSITVEEEVAEFPAAASIQIEEVVEEEENVVLLNQIDQNSVMLDETIKQYGDSNTGFQPYYNPKTEKTMYVSADGRSCYYVTDPPTKTTNVSP